MSPAFFKLATLQADRLNQTIRSAELKQPSMTKSLNNTKTELKHGESPELLIYRHFARWTKIMRMKNIREYFAKTSC